MMNITLNKDDRLDYKVAAAMEEAYYKKEDFVIRFSLVSYIEVKISDDDIYCINVTIDGVDLTPLEIERPRAHGEMEIVWERPEDPAYISIGDFILLVETAGVSWDDHTKRFEE